MKIGYARVSTEDQNLEAQCEQLRIDGCVEVFAEKVTGKKGSRPALDEALSRLQSGDTLVVWKLDRLGRSLKNLVTILQELESASVCFRSISDGIDTGTPTGKLLFHLLGAVAEFEASLISERTRLGMQAAKRQGRPVGRPPRMAAEALAQAIQLRASENISYTDLARQMKVGRATAWRAVNHSR